MGKTIFKGTQKYSSVIVLPSLVFHFKLDLRCSKYTHFKSLNYRDEIKNITKLTWQCNNNIFATEVLSLIVNVGAVFVVCLLPFDALWCQRYNWHAFYNNLEIIKKNTCCCITDFTYNLKYFKSFNAERAKAFFPYKRLLVYSCIGRQ